MEGPATLTASTNSMLSHADYGKLYGWAQSSDRARVIWVKIQTAPRVPGELYRGDERRNDCDSNIGTIAIPPVPAYVTYMQKYSLTASATPQPYESAVCLAMALQRNVSGVGTITPETFGSGTYVSTNIAPNQCPCLVDAWKNPLAFSRWPVGLNLTCSPTRPIRMVCWPSRAGPA